MDENSSRDVSRDGPSDSRPRDRSTDRGAPSLAAGIRDFVYPFLEEEESQGAVGGSPSSASREGPSDSRPRDSSTSHGASSASVSFRELTFPFLEGELGTASGVPPAAAPGGPPEDAEDDDATGECYDDWDQSEVHHYHHQHCPGHDCPENPVPAPAPVPNNLDVELRRMRRVIGQAVTTQERLVQTCERIVEAVTATLQSIDSAISPCRCRNHRARPHTRGAQGISPPRRRSTWDPADGWEVITVLSPPRGRGRNQVRCRPSTSPSCAAEPSRPQQSPSPSLPPRHRTPPPDFTPQLPERRSIRLSPTTSPSRLGSHLRATHPEFSATTRRNTREYLYTQFVRTRELNQSVSSEVGWARFVGRITRLGIYTSEDELRRAWQLSFEQYVNGHFHSLWRRSLEELRSALPETWSFRPQDLVQF